jgi:hypothetical protein
VLRKDNESDVETVTGRPKPRHEYPKSTDGMSPLSSKQDLLTYVVTPLDLNF